MARSVDERLDAIESSINSISKALDAKGSGDDLKAGLGRESLALMSQVNKAIGLSIRGRAALFTTVTTVTLVTLFDDDEEIVAPQCW